MKRPGHAPVEPGLLGSMPDSMPGAEQAPLYAKPRGLGRFALAALLGLMALLASLGLLSLSGHFLTAAALAGVGAVAFDIFRPGSIIRLFAIVRTAARYGERLASHDAVLRLLADLRTRAYAKLARLAPEPLARWRDGDLLQRLVADIDALDEAPLRAWLPMLYANLVVLAALLVIGHAELALAWVAAPWLFGALWFVPLAFSHHAQRAGERLAAQASLRRERLIDLLRGLPTLRLTGAWPAWRGEWETLDRQTVDAQFRLRLREAAAQAGVSLLVGLAAWRVLAAGGFPLRDGGVSGPWLAAAVLAALATLEAVAPQAGALIALARSRAAARRVDDLLEQAPAVEFPERGIAPPARGEVVFDAVRFRYPQRETAIDIPGLRIEAGARLIVEGPSGAGKSTFAALLCRVFDPDEGRILLDGENLRDYDEATLRQRIAWLPQRPHLFAATLADNLRLGDPQADESRLLGVLEAVALRDWFERLPQGFDTRIGEYGHGLSGGEARRVALAAVLLRDAKLVILDEAFEGLDAITAAHVARGIDAWLGDATLVAITHRAVDFGAPTRRVSMRQGTLFPAA